MKRREILWPAILLIGGAMLWASCAGKSKANKLAINLLQGTELESLSPTIEFTSFSPTGSSAVAEGTVTTGFRFERENGKWVLKDIRLAEMQWIRVQDLKEALDQILRRRTQGEMKTILQAAEKYRQVNGAYPAAVDFVDLVDKLSPGYLPEVIRLDAWNSEFRIQRQAGGFAVISNGPDRKPDTADDLRLP
ncbi:MAG TPA: hypothetical protein VGK99_02250 [Acidobacteriota bacterium]|jgi:hypothetical protein